MGADGDSVATTIPWRKIAVCGTAACLGYYAYHYYTTNKNSKDAPKIIVVPPMTPMAPVPPKVNDMLQQRLTELGALGTVNFDDDDDEDLENHNEPKVGKNDDSSSSSTKDGPNAGGDLDPSVVLGFLTSQVKMLDPVTNRPIYPLVTIIDLPESHFNFTSVAKVNNVHRGILHLIFRHSAELERVIEGFSLSDLPPNARKIVRQLQTAPETSAKDLLTALDKQVSTHDYLKKLTTRMQLMVLDFLNEYMTEEHYMGEIVDNRGRKRAAWRIYNKHHGEEAMITPFASALNKPTNEIRRPFREIVAFSFVPMPAAVSKMNRMVMHCDWASTCSTTSSTC